MDDPKACTKPWKFTTHPVMLKGELMEHICQENNRDVEPSPRQKIGRVLNSWEFVLHSVGPAS